MRKKSMKENAILNALRTLAGIVFPLITYPYISRVLGADNLGKINFANSIVSYFSLLAALGISTLTVKVVSPSGVTLQVKFCCSKFFTKTSTSSL